MNETKEEIVKSITKGDIKEIPGIFATQILEHKELEKLLIDAGAQIAGYEREKSEESDIRAISFGKENMCALAKYMQHVDGFSWMEELHNCIRNLLSDSEMSKTDQKSCEQKFCAIVEQKLRSQFPPIMEQSLLCNLDTEMSEIQPQIADIRKNIRKILEEEEKIAECLHRQEEEKQHQRQEHYESYSETETKNSEYSIPKWNLADIDIRGIFKPKEEREQEILRLIDLWSSERKKYPGWCILPYTVCNELEHKTKEMGLLQSHAWVDRRIMLFYSYELVWRYEKCLHLYSHYEIHHITQIWDSYASVIQSLTKTDLKEKQEDMEKWFYIGQVLLRIFRENGNDTEWKKSYSLLKKYETYGINGEVELQLEKAKYELHHFRIPDLRRELNQCHPGKEQYEQRLQLLGLRIECDGANAFIPEIRRLIQDMQGRVEESNTEEFDEQYRVFCLTLKACILQLLSLCEQGTRDFEEQNEIYRNRLNQIFEKMERQKDLFNWEEWESRTERALLKWHTRKYEKSEAFELERETVTLLSSENICEDAYRFYRVLEKLALPLHCGYVTLLGNMAQPWMQALLEINHMLGLVMLIRSNQSSIIKILVDRDYVTMLEQEEADTITALLIDAIDCNLDEIEVHDGSRSTDLVLEIRSSVPELLIRFMSRCPENLQQKALRLVRKLMEDENLPVSFPMAELMIGVLQNVSEKQKAKMLEHMLQTRIYEHKTLHGHGDGIDVFDCYFSKTDIGSLKQYCVIDPDVISELLQYTWKTDYEWRTKVIRLSVLDEHGLLNLEQEQLYAKLMWSKVSEKSGLPVLPNLHLFAYEQLPCIDASVPVRSVKSYFLNQRLKDQFQDKEGCNFTMGDIPYLDELILLCENVKKDYWSEEEAGDILKNITEYWKILKKKYEVCTADNQIQHEYGKRAKKMIEAAAGICQNISANLDMECKSELNQMIQEMQQYGISTKELEIQVSEDGLLLQQIKNEMCSVDDKLAVGALSAAYSYIRKHAKKQGSQELFDEMIKILRYHKQPGLISAVWLFHNLAYIQNPILDSENLTKLDECLQELAVTIRPDRSRACGLRMKDILSVRRACAALAFQMYHMDETHAGKGVLLWKELVVKEEINVVKNEWVW